MLPNFPEQNGAGLESEEKSEIDPSIAIEQALKLKAETEAMEAEIKALEKAVASGKAHALDLKPEHVRAGGAGTCDWIFSTAVMRKKNLTNPLCGRPVLLGDVYCKGHVQVRQFALAAEKRGEVNPRFSYAWAKELELIKMRKSSKWTEFGVQKKGLQPLDALMTLIYEAAGNVEYYRDRINESEVLIVTGKQSREEIAGLVLLYNEERDRLAGYLQQAMRANLDQRQQALYQIQATAMVTIFRRLIHSLKLSTAQKQIALIEISDGLREFAQEQNSDAWRGPFIEAEAKHVESASDESS